MNSALIISTYNWPEALELVLKSVRMQKVYPDEVIIADDGSTDETKKLINKNQKDFPVPIKHFWHQDKGFRKSHILNLAIANSNADYIIQIDGDCILDKFFIKDHLHSVRENTYLFGSRVNINASYQISCFYIKKLNLTTFQEDYLKEID